MVRNNPLVSAKTSKIVSASFPSKLSQIIDFFESLSETERRENLVSFAERAKNWEPISNEQFDFEDVRKDEQCTDTVGIFLKVKDGKLSFRISMGPKVQTPTRALATILCQVMEGSTLEETLAVNKECIAKIVGEKLVRLRSQTVYYLLSRMQSAASDLS